MHRARIGALRTRIRAVRASGGHPRRDGPRREDERHVNARLHRHWTFLLSLVLFAAAVVAGACSNVDRNQLEPGHPEARTNDAPALPDDELRFIVIPEAATTPGEIALAEGNVARVSVRLSKPPANPVIALVAFSQENVLGALPAALTFDASNYNVPQSVTLSALQDDNAISETVEVKLTAADLADVKTTVKVADDDVQTLVVEPTLLTVTEGQTDAFLVRPAFAPAGEMTVSIVSSKPAAATSTAQTVTFTAADYETPKRVEIAGVADPDVVDESVDFALTTAGLPDTAVSVTVTDKDTLNISLTTSSLALTEGAGAKTFGVSLTQQPSAPVTVTLTSSDPGAATVSPATLTFTAASYATAQTVTVTPVDDADAASEAITVRVSAPALTPKDVTVTLKDDDVQDIVPSVANLTVREGGAATFGVRLAFDPVTPLTVDLRSSNPGAATVSPATLTFTSADYATPKTVAVAGVIDNNTVAENVTLTLVAAGLPTRSVAVTTVDADTQAIVAAPAAASVTEVGTSTVGVRLAFNPLASTVVTVASSDTSAMTVSPATLTFTSTNWATPQNVTLAGVRSAGTTNRTASATLTAPGIATASVPVTIVDVDVQSLSIAPTSLTLTEGGASGTVAVKLTQAPTADVTVSVVSENPGAATVSPATLTFTPASYATPQNVTVTPVRDANAVVDTAAIAFSAPGLTTQRANVTVNDADAQALVDTPATLSVTEGATATFTVRLAFAPTATTAVSLTSSNGLAVSPSPSSVTFTPTDYATPKTVTVTGVADANMTSETVVVTAASAGIPNASVTVTTVDTTKAACDMPATLPTPSDGNHNAGVSCIQSGCHTQPRKSVTAPMTIAGTLYGSVSGGTAIAQATIHVIDANGVDHKLSTATNGNFWTTDPIAFPVRVRASKCPNIDQSMNSAVDSTGGSCNSCHGAGFRIHLP